MAAVVAAGLLWAIAAAAAPTGRSAGAPDPCSALLASRPLAPATAESASEQAPAGSSAPPPAAAVAGDYRHRLRPSPLGWVHRRHWCVWIEPPSGETAAAPWEQRWRRAVEAALVSWRGLLPITVVSDPAQAQVLIQRRRPPRRSVAGTWRASHGRAELLLREVQRADTGPAAPWRREPLVQVQISPGQHERAIQATALHELGHAFGLWGHSDHSGDAMAAAPGATPVLELSPRDRATLTWLMSQPSAVDR